MMARRSFMMALCGALALAGCDLGPNMPARTRWAYRYRLTLEIETPEGVRTGSSVVEVHSAVAEIRAIDLSGGNMSSGVKGEAVVVDLGPRGLLFALLAGRGEKGGLGSPDEAVRLPAKVFLREGTIHYDNGRQLQGALMGLRASAELIDKEIPFLVRFRDVNDPKTVEAVDPNDLAKSFGPGVRLKRATIEMTGDPVTTGIEKRLGWLDNLRTGSITGMTEFDVRKPDPVNYLPAVAFRRGTRK